MTDLEALGRMEKHLIEQGHQAIDGTTCKYRMDNGDMCAVGCLIEEYKLEYEHLDLIRVKELANIQVSYTVLARAQMVHDEYERIEDGDWTEYITVKFAELGGKI